MGACFDLNPKPTSVYIDKKYLLLKKASPPRLGNRYLVTLSKYFDRRTLQDFRNFTPSGSSAHKLIRIRCCFALGKRLILPYNSGPPHAEA